MVATAAVGGAAVAPTRNRESEYGLLLPDPVIRVIVVLEQIRRHERQLQVDARNATPLRVSLNEGVPFDRDWTRSGQPCKQEQTNLGTEIQR